MEFFGFVEFTIKIFKDNKSANSFPSGHVAEPFCLVLVAFSIKEYLYGSIGLFISCCILIATLVLRYHYLVDVLAAIIISFLCYSSVYFSMYKKTINEKFLEENLSRTQQIIKDNIKIKENDTNTKEEENNKYYFINNEDTERKII